MNVLPFCNVRSWVFFVYQSPTARFWAVRLCTKCARLCRFHQVKRQKEPSLMCLKSKGFGKKLQEKPFYGEKSEEMFGG